MEKIRLVLKNERLKHYDRIAIIILILDQLLFVYFFINAPNKFAFFSSAFFGTILLIILILYFLANRKKDPSAHSYLHVAFVFATLGWIATGKIAAIIASVLLLLLYKLARRQAAIIFHNEKIELQSMRANSIEWNLLSNVILKDGWLTLDFKNNKIIQALVENNAEDVNEQEFNEFCRMRLTASQ